MLRMLWCMRCPHLNTLSTRWPHVRRSLRPRAWKYRILPPPGRPPLCHNHGATDFLYKRLQEKPATAYFPGLPTLAHTLGINDFQHSVARMFTRGGSLESKMRSLVALAPASHHSTLMRSILQDRHVGSLFKTGGGAAGGASMAFKLR